MSTDRPPFPPFTRETAIQKIRAAEDGWNSCDPERVSLAYTIDSKWRNRSEFLQGRPAIVVAGRNYGCGSSRDWAAKGTKLLGVRVVIAESFERIHRSNLVGMGVLPLQFPPGMTRHSLGLTGEETFDLEDVSAAFVPGATVPVCVRRASGAAQTLALVSRVDTRREAEWLRHGGILPYVLEELGAA